MLANDPGYRINCCNIARSHGARRTETIEPLVASTSSAQKQKHFFSVRFPKIPNRHTLLRCAVSKTPKNKKTQRMSHALRKRPEKTTPAPDPMAAAFCASLRRLARRSARRPLREGVVAVLFTDLRSVAFCPPAKSDQLFVGLIRETHELAKSVNVLTYHLPKGTNMQTSPDQAVVTIKTRYSIG